MNTKIYIYILTGLLGCRAEGVFSAEVKEQSTAAVLESATPPPSQSQPPVQEDLGVVLIDGRTNKIIHVRTADPVSVLVIYENDEGSKGGRKIPRQELPPQLQADRKSV